METAITGTQTSFRMSVAQKPNETTLAAMHEAETSENLETLDLSNFRNFVDSL